MMIVFYVMGLQATGIRRAHFFSEAPFPLDYRQSERGGLDPLPTHPLSDDSESPK